MDDESASPEGMDLTSQGAGTYWLVTVTIRSIFSLTGLCLNCKRISDFGIDNVILSYSRCISVVLMIGKDQ